MADQSRLDSQLFTCLSCSIAFLTPEDQRIHYRSDHHRYNMKRRVAGLPPISEAVFNQKVIERRTETAIMSSTKHSTCSICNKTYTTENAYRSHIQSKKHKENELKASFTPASPSTTETTEVNKASTPSKSETAIVDRNVKAPSEAPRSDTEGSEDEDEIIKTIDEKIAAARSRLSEKNCLFCNNSSSSLDDNLMHMSTAHSFFIPDTEYLVDLPGLITYLGEKIAVGNVCVYCNQKGREFRSMDAVRKHMLDKSHCKIAYDREKDRMELSDFYDFTSSYPDTTKSRNLKKQDVISADAEWEDADDIGDEDVDEIIDESASDATTDSEDDDFPENQLSYGDTEYELVLPSGARIGHRSMKRYYAQSLPVTPRGNKPEDPSSGAALVRKLLADKNSALVSRKGGFGAYGSGTEIVKARNRGEAREAGRHVREFRDQRRREDFKTKVAFIHNSQKHFRDPLLQ